MNRLGKVDWWIVSPVLLLSLIGIVTITPLESGLGVLLSRQTIFIVIGFLLFFVVSQIDWSFLNNTSLVTILYALMLLVFIILLLVGQTWQGAQSWFQIGSFGLQPSDPAKIILILTLAKYFSRRHVEIAQLRHIVVSGVYGGLFFLLVAIQPDLGSALVLGSIWLGMVWVSGIPKKYLLVIFALTLVSFSVGWNFVLKDYQKDRIRIFINPLSDLQGSGYNAYQATIAIGSGQVLGKGIGYGTQSRLQYLPEYKTDFIFAAFAEEWGLGGVILLFSLFFLLLGRLLFLAAQTNNNFIALFILGVALYLLTHFIIHIGGNLGLMPITGITMPFMSSGGTHLFTEFLALGMVIGMTRQKAPLASFENIARGDEAIFPPLKDIIRTQKQLDIKT